MADTKISGLTALTGANVDTAADILPIVDTSAGSTKKITVDELGLALQPFSDGEALVRGSSDATKLLRFEVDGFTTGTTRVLTAPNFDGTISTLAGTETLTNKSLTSPTVTGTPTAAGSTWTSLGSVTTIDINGGTIDNTAIGGTTPAAGAFTTLSSTGNATLSTAAGVGLSVVGGASSVTLRGHTGTNTDTLLESRGIGAVYLVSPGLGNVYANINSVNVGNFSSTGLSVTGELSATGTTTSTGTYVAGSEFSFSGATGLGAPVRFTSGALAQPLIFYVGQFGVDAAEIARATSTGLSVTGALSCSTNLTVTGGIVTTGSATALSLNTGGGTVADLRYVASSVNYLQIIPSATTGESVILRAAGTDTNVSLYYDTQGSGYHIFRTGNGGASTQVQITHTASAVNYLTLTGAATGGAAPTISIGGSDTNVNLAIVSKGTGSVYFNTGGGNQVQVINTASANRYITLTGSNGGNPAISVSGGELAVGTNAWTFGVANSVSPTSPNRTLTVTIGGTTYYIAAKTTND